MKPLARIAIPDIASKEVVGAIALILRSSFSFIEIEFELKPGIANPKVLSFDRNGADLGSIDGNLDAPSIALFGAIHNEANRVFQEERAKEST
jgi:hypothetical protein